MKSFHAHKGENSNRGETGLDQGEHNVPVDTQESSAINARSMLQIVEEAFHELPQQEDEEGIPAQREAPQRLQSAVSTAEN